MINQHMPYLSRVRAIHLLLILCTVAFTVFPLTAQASDHRTVKIAVSLPLGIEIGEQMLNGVQLALDEVNHQVGDVHVELLILNTSEPDAPLSTSLEREVAEQAIADNEVIAYLGPISSDQVKSSIALLNEAGIVQVAPVASWPGLTKPGYGPGEPGIYYPTGRRHFFRTVASDDAQALAAAQWAEQLGFESVFIVDDGSLYGQGLSGIFELAASDFGIDIVGYQSLNDDSSPETITTVTESVLHAEPDLLYFGGGASPHGSPFIAHLRQLDATLSIMGADAFVTNDLIDHIGEQESGDIFGTNLAIPATELTTESGIDFVEQYRLEYGHDPLPLVVSTYEATKVLLHAIDTAEEPTREGVLNSVLQMEDFDGVVGRWHFDEYGDTSLLAVSGMQVLDSEWVFVQVIE